MKESYASSLNSIAFRVVRYRIPYTVHNAAGSAAGLFNTYRTYTMLANPPHNCACCLVCCHPLESYTSTAQEKSDVEPELPDKLSKSWKDLMSLAKTTAEVSDACLAQICLKNATAISNIPFFNYRLHTNPCTISKQRWPLCYPAESHWWESKRNLWIHLFHRHSETQESAEARPSVSYPV